MIHNYFYREKLIFFLALIILIAGVILPWYYLPPQTLKVFDTSITWINIFRLIPIFSIILIIIFLVYLPQKIYLRLVLWLGLLLVFLFPYLLTTWQPKINFIATNYENQTESVVRHIESNYSEIESQWKRNIFLSQPTSLSELFENISIKSSQNWQIPFWENLLLEGLGYQRSFVNFIGKGWMLTGVGIIFALVAVYLSWGSENLNIFLKDLKIIVPVAIVTLAIFTISLIQVNLMNYQIYADYNQGKYDQVITTSNFLSSLYPPIVGNRKFVERLAKAQFYLDKAQPHTISLIKGLELYDLGYYEKAEYFLQESLELQPDQFLIRGYLASAILNQAVNDFNRQPHIIEKSLQHPIRKYSSAINKLTKVLQIYPYQMEALYYLMIATAANGDFENSATIAEKIISEKQFWEIPQQSLLGQAYLHLAWSDYHREDLERSWKRYNQYLTQEFFKDPFAEVQ